MPLSIEIKKKVNLHLERLLAIKTLYKGYYNTNQELFAKEFYYAVGELLEGNQLKRLDLKHLNLKELLEE